MNNEIQVLTEYIRNETGFTGSLGADDDLLESGVLDSFNIVSLAAISGHCRVTFVNPSDRLKANVAPLVEWYKLHTTEYESLRFRLAPLFKETPPTK